MKVIASLALLLALAAGGAAPSYAAEESSGPGAWLEHVCARDGDASRQTERAQRRADRLGERLKLTDAQKAAFKDFADTRAKLRADHLTQLCANKPDLSTLEKRLAFRQARLETRLSDMKIEAPKLLAFVNSLDAQQKAQFDDMRRGGRDGDEHRRHGDDDDNR